MSLGNAFPAEFARTQIERQLKPGSVLKFLARMDDGKIHEKRFIVLNINEKTFTCVINSKISPLLARNQNAAICQVSIAVDSHDFMERDSHVDCSRVRSYDTSDVIDQLCKNPKWILGEITEVLKNEISAGLKASKTVPIAVARQCCESLLVSKL
jgi:HD superfamily phosphohydrolase